MTEQLSQSIDTGRFHFKIGDAVLSEAKSGKPVDQVGLAEAQPEDAPLGGIEPRTGNGNAMIKIAHKMLEQGGAAAADVGKRKPVVQLRLRNERLHQLFFFFVVFDPVKIQEVVDAQSVGGGHHTIHRYGSLQRAGGTDADDLQLGAFGLDGAGIEIDVYQGIQLVEHDVDVVGTDAGRHHRYIFAADRSGIGYKLPVARRKRDAIKVFAHLSSPVRGHLR